jgi:Uncharacterized protein conserved in bacteria (DUF2188)
LNRVERGPDLAKEATGKEATMQPRETFYVMPDANGRVWEVIQSLAMKTALFANRVAAEAYARGQAEIQGHSEIVTMNLEGRVTDRTRIG